jgi:predicted membrane protein
MKENNSRLIFGGILIFLGLLFLLDQFNIFSQFGISAWFVVGLVWPALLVYFGYKIYSNSRSYWGIFLMVVGCIVFAEKFVDVNFWSIVWPVAIIGAGFFVLFKKEGEISEVRNVSSFDGDMINEDVVFWGIDKKITSKSFKGGEINCIFGGGKLDISDAGISKDGADLEVNCIFGGLDVIVPEKCKVISDGTGVFGGWDVKTKEGKEGPELRITGSAVFGGVEIKR